MRSVAGGIDGIGAVFDDGSLVADAGLLLAGTVMSRLGLEALIDDTVRPGGSAGSGAGRKVLSLVASMLVGGRCIDDVQRLRSGSAAAVLPFAVVAPSTAGSFLRSFTFGHVRQLDKAAELGLRRAWSVGAAPDVAEMTLDLDSTVCEVCGKAKHGAAYGHTKVLGYHPLVAVRSDTGEVLHSRMRSGSSQRGNVHFARETLARLRRLGAHAAVTVRADAGFFSYDMIAAIGAHGASYSITIPQNAKVKAATEAIDDDAWQAIAYTRGARAQVAESTITAGRRGDKLRGDDGAPAKLRLIVRRTRLLGAQGELWPNWRHHCFVTDRHDLDTCAADTYHRAHATVELAIRDLKESAGLSRCPSGRFFANGAWLACCVLAHNLARWTARLGRAHPTRQLTVAATIRNRLLTVPGRLVNHSDATDCACRHNWPAAQLAMGKHLHHRPGTHPQPAPTHLSRPQRPAQRSRTPPATNRTSPALQSCTPQNAPARTHAPAQRPPDPKPSIPQTRPWIQAQRTPTASEPSPPNSSSRHSRARLIACPPDRWLSADRLGLVDLCPVALPGLGASDAENLADPVPCRTVGTGGSHGFNDSTLAVALHPDVPPQDELADRDLLGLRPVVGLTPASDRVPVPARPCVVDEFSNCLRHGTHLKCLARAGIA